MGNIEGLSIEEIKELILDQINELGINLDAVEIEVAKGPKVVLRGKTDSAGERALLERAIMDIVGVDDVVDELVVIRAASNSLEDEELEEESGFHDEDDEKMGTEDVSQSVEDGIPYIPPDHPRYQEISKTRKWKKKKKQ